MHLCNDRNHSDSGYDHILPISKEITSMGVVISYESWDPHGLMITHWDADTYIIFKSVSPSCLSKPSTGLFPFALSTPHIFLLDAIYLSALFVTFQPTSRQ